MDSVTGPYGHDYTQLCNRLTSLKGAPVVYVQCPGNAGDAIITTGTMQLFNRIGLNPDVGNWDGVYPNSHIIFAGSGAFVPYYRRTRSCIEANFQTLKSFTLLPSSVRGHEDLLARLDDRFEIYARELATYRHLVEHAPNARVLLTHDMAFMNDFDEMRAMLAGLTSVRRSKFGTRLYFRESQAYITWMLSRLKRWAEGNRLPSQDKVLNAYRTDKERVSQGPYADKNIDISKLFSMNRDEVLFLTARIAEKFVEAIDKYDIVKTDRLHVSIAATMLGKTVYVGDNSYGKIEAVRSHSMTNFNNIHPDSAA